MATSREHSRHGAARDDHPGMHAASSPYRRFALMILLSFLAMYVLMYAMVDSFANVFLNINQFYMAGLMAAPMAIFELVLMGSMYRNKRWNTLIAVASVVALCLCWFGIRRQVAVGDKQFLRSMIPHHAGAVLMCEQAPIRDAQVRALCGAIIVSQQSEIQRMKDMLR
jgi:Domain of unknown function (DUF305)